MRVATSSSVGSSSVVLESSGLSARSSSVLARFALIATLAAAADLLTKAVATAFLSDGRFIELSTRTAFMLVYNTGSAGGASIGPYTWAINVGVTAAAILMIMRIVSPLSAVDSRATRALALVCGGAFGNLASMLGGPEGVADFIAVDLPNGATIVMNVADLLLWGGALMLLPVVGRLIAAVRAERVAA